MNKLLFLTKHIYIVIATLSLAMFGCQKEDAPEADLSVDVAEIILKDNKLQTVDIEVKSNTEWTAIVMDDQSQTPSWFYLVEASSNAGINTLTVSISESNPSYDNIRKGSIIITAGNKSITVPITQPVKQHVIDVDKVSITGEEQHYLRKGGSVALTAIVIPDNATNKNIIWESSNKKVATVDENGLVTSLGYGTTRITVRTEDGNKTALVDIDVEMYMAGDYYPDANVTFSAPGVVESGTMPIGVVVSTSNFGRNGLIASLDEVLRSWGPMGITAGTGEADGLLNTNKIKNEMDINSYPGYKWCIEKTTGSKSWFLPSLEQIDVLYDQFTKDRNALDNKFTAAGGAKMMSQSPWYCSSTEVDPQGGNWPNIFWMVSFGDKYHGHGQKNDPNITIRAMTKF